MFIFLWHLILKLRVNTVFVLLVWDIQFQYSRRKKDSYLEVQGTSLNQTTINKSQPWKSLSPFSYFNNFFGKFSLNSVIFIMWKKKKKSDEKIANIYFKGIHLSVQLLFLVSRKLR